MTKKEIAERKRVLIGLARDMKFESVIFPIEFKFSGREPVRYYLWMRELELWLLDNHNIKVNIYNCSDDVCQVMVKVKGVTMSKFTKRTFARVEHALENGLTDAINFLIPTEHD
jgi:hypothetical protein